MKLADLIKADFCTILQSRTKTEAIHELLDIVEKNGAANHMENLKKEIFYREQIMSTGIGRGLAVPHVRFEGVNEPIILIGTKPKGIGDYESLDDETVKIVIMILVGAEQHKEYLRILSLIVHKLKSSSLQDKILQCRDGNEIVSALLEE